MNDILTNEKFLCTKCNNTNYNTLISVTNSTYEYCSDCNYNLNEVLKQSKFDSIYKGIINYLKNNKSKNLKIEITKNYTKLNLLIDDITIVTSDFIYDILDKDIYFLENTIHELVEDLCDKDNFKSDIIICV